MWWLPSSVVLPVGNPLVGLSLLEVTAVATMLVVGVLILLVARLTTAGREAKVVHCVN